jgi:ABC-2 type transport system permease protein
MRAMKKKSLKIKIPPQDLNSFGMDKLNFGEFMGYFGIECGNVLGLGGALFAALAGISALAKEEKDRTAEFLL